MGPLDRHTCPTGVAPTDGAGRRPPAGAGESPADTDRATLADIANHPDRPGGAPPGRAGKDKKERRL